MRPILVTVFALFAVAAVLRLYRFNSVRLGEAHEAMVRCLRRQGLEVVSARLCWMAWGPFAEAIARHQPVYRVRARDRLGRVRSGWVRCEPFTENTEAAWQVKPGEAWPPPRR